MYSVILFWTLSALLTSMALCFVLPWIRLNSRFGTSFFRLFCALLIPGFAYSIYAQFGESRQLAAYYSEASQNTRKKDVGMRRMLGDLRKKEFRLHQKLEENPNDKETQWNLLNVMGIEAYEKSEFDQAVLYWQQALEIMPHTEEQMFIRALIERLVVSAQAVSSR